jgi:integrase
LALAREEGIRDDDPTAGIKRPKLGAEGWHTWTEDEISQYEAHHPIGTQARLTLALALYTGQRRGDLVRMGRQHRNGDVISVRQQKTGALLTIPLHPKLAAILEAIPSGNLTYLVGAQGMPLAPNGLTTQFIVWAKKAGLSGCPLHGLRKAACRRLAEAGCTAHQIMAISGHKTLAEVQRYCAAASQKELAQQAISRTTLYPRDEQSYPRSNKA